MLEVLRPAVELRSGEVFCSNRNKNKQVPQAAWPCANFLGHIELATEDIQNCVSV